MSDILHRAVYCFSRNGSNENGDEPGHMIFDEIAVHV